MHIKKIRLTNFRNFTDATVSFSQGPNLIVGENGGGKTNLLEAIHLLGIGRSHRERRDANLIRFGAGYYRVEGHFFSNDLKWIVEIAFDGGRKLIKINGKEAKPSELIGLVGIVVSAPEDIEIIKGSPLLRRSFLDMAICQIDKQYLVTLQRYHRILVQRNTLLKSCETNTDSHRQIQTWDEKLVEAATFLVDKRIEYIGLLTPKFEDNLRTIVGRSIKAKLVYLPRGYTLDERLDLALKNGLERVHQIEIARGYTLIGPHCDDLQFDIDGRNLRVFGSEGEQRSAVIALKCAEADILIDMARRSPILLLDDVFAELDERRSRALGTLICKFDQIILTSSRGPQIAKDGVNILTVEGGRVVQDGTV